MKLFKLTFAIAIAACLLAATTVQAENRYSTGNGDWSSSSSWNTQSDGTGDPGIPQADDDVFVQAGDEITVSSQTNSVRSVAVQSSATLSLAASSDLRIENTLNINASGTFRFYADDGETLPILRSAGTLVVTGDIKVVDPQDADGGAGGVLNRLSTDSFHLSSGSITSDDGPVTISAPIENDGTIQATNNSITLSDIVLDGSTGTFAAHGADMLFSAEVNNDGTISAQNGHDVTFSGTIHSGSAGLFQVTAADSDMTFNMSSIASITSNADFNVEAGRMYFAQTLSTDGGYRQIGGQLEVAAGKSFQASGTY